MFGQLFPNLDHLMDNGDDNCGAAHSPFPFQYDFTLIVLEIHGLHGFLRGRRLLLTGGCI